MKILDLIFQLLYAFVPMNEGDFAKIKSEGHEWYTNIRIDEEAMKEKPTILMTAKKHAEMWYSKVFFAIAFIILKRKIADYLANAGKVEEDDED